MTEAEKAAAVLFALMTNCHDCGRELVVWNAGDGGPLYCRECDVFTYADREQRQRLYPQGDQPDHPRVRFLND